MRGQHSVVRNLGTLTIAQIATQLLNLVVLVYLGRTLDEHWFGVVQVGVAFSAYALITAEWGQIALGVREISRLDDPAQVLRYGRTQTGLLGVQALVIVAVGLLVLPLLPFYPTDRGVFVLYLLTVLPQVFMQTWIATGLERMGWVGTARTARSLVYAVLVLLLLKPVAAATGWPSYRLVPAFFLAGFAAMDLTVMIPLARTLGRPVLPAWPGWREARRRWREARSLGASIVVLRVMLNVDLLLLGVLAAPETAGNYAAASRVIFLVVIAVEVLWGALLPRLSRLASRSPAGFRRSFNRYLGLLTAGLLPVSLGGALLGPELMALLYGDRFPDAGGVFRVLAVSYGLLAGGTYLGSALVAADRQRAYFPPLVTGALVALVGNLLLIPRLGAGGAALGMLAAHGVLAAMMIGLHRRTFDRALGRLLLLLLPALGALAAVVATSGGWPTVPRIAMGGAAYVAVAAWPVRRFLGVTAPSGGDAG